MRRGGTPETQSHFLGKSSRHPMANPSQKKLMLTLVMEDDLTAAAGCDEFVLSTRVGVEERAVCVITLVGQF